MRRNCSIFVCGVAILTVALAFLGCGGLEVGEVDTKPLKLVGLYPQTGETVSAQDLMVIVVFSETVGFGSSSTDVNETTFYLEDDNQNPVAGTVDDSEPDPQKATALLKLDDPLVSGETYWVVLESTIQGTDANGEATEPLGDKIRSFFVVE